MDTEILANLRTCNLFTELTEVELTQVLPFVSNQNLQAGELLLHEDDAAAAVFILCSGTIEIFKLERATQYAQRIALLMPGAPIGELALLDETKRSASARALTDCHVLRIELQSFKNLMQSTEGLITYNKILLNVARGASRRLRRSNNQIVRSLTKALHLEKTRSLMGRLLINLLIILSVYIFLLDLIGRFAREAVSTTLIGAPLILGLGGITYIFIKKNKFPLAFYGLTLHGWRQALLEGCGFSVPVMLLMTALKYIVISTIPHYTHVALFMQTGVSAELLYRATQKWLIFSLELVYLLLVPAQELLFRGVIQGCLLEFFTGRYRALSAILVANFIFSATHLHVGLGLALLVFLPGLFWGWLYARHRTLLGVTLSHGLIGGFAFFVLGIDAFLH